MSTTSPSTASTATTGPTVVPAAWQNLARGALMLERLDRLPRHSSAAQYQALVQQVQRSLAKAEPGPWLDRLLSSFPALAELYENQQYAHAGLCRSPLDAGLSAEQAARAALARLQKPATDAGPGATDRGTA